MDNPILEQKIVNVSSADGTLNNGTFKSNITFNFKNVLYDDPDIISISTGLLNAQIPVSFYTINYTNDTLNIKVNSDVNKTLSITRGNYNSNSLITELQTQLLAAGYTFAIATSRITGIMTFTSVGNSFTFYGTSTLFSILGFAIGTNYNSSSSSIVAPYPLNLLGIKRLKVNSVALSTIAYDSRNMGMRSTIASVPVNVASYSLIDYVNTTNAYPICQAKTVSAIDIHILDENDNYINFNNTDWTMTLQINVIRQNIKRVGIFEPMISVLQDIKEELAPEDKTDDIPAVPYNAPTDNDLDLLLYNHTL